MVTLKVASFMRLTYDCINDLYSLSVAFDMPSGLSPGWSSALALDFSRLAVPLLKS